MNISSFTNLISSTFTDRMDIYHYHSSTNADRTEDTILSSVPDEYNVPCRISYIKIESPLNVDVTGTPVETTPKLFCGLSTGLRVGDYIVVRRMSGTKLLRTYKGQVGLPAVHETHQEALFSIKEFA